MLLCVFVCHIDTKVCVCVCVLVKSSKSKCVSRVGVQGHAGAHGLVLCCSDSHWMFSLIKGLSCLCVMALKKRQHNGIIIII